jgi:hypothetical protein
VGDWRGNDLGYPCWSGLTAPTATSFLAFFALCVLGAASLSMQKMSPSEFLSW